MNINRTFSHFLIALSFIAGLLGFGPAETTGTKIIMTASLPSGQINVNDTFDIPVTINIPNDKPLGGVGFNLSWNPAVLELIDIYRGDGSQGLFDPSEPANPNCPVTGSAFFNSPTIDNTVGTAKNFGYQGIGLNLGEGCTGSGTIATISFRALANGISISQVSKILLTYTLLDGNSYNYADTDPSSYTFSPFSVTVGPDIKLVVTNVALQMTGMNQFKARVTVANQGTAASLPNTALSVSTDGNSVPVKQSISLPSIGSGSSQVFTFNGFSLASGKTTSTVSAAVITYSTSASSNYTQRTVYLPAIVK